MTANPRCSVKTFPVPLYGTVSLFWLLQLSLWHIQHYTFSVFALNNEALPFYRYRIAGISHNYCGKLPISLCSAILFTVRSDYLQKQLLARVHTSKKVRDGNSLDLI